MLMVWFAQACAFMLLSQVAADNSLVYGKQLRLIGSFDIPVAGSWQDPLNQRYDYSKGTICYREDRDALYVVTHAQDPTSVGLIQVPSNLSTSKVIVNDFLPC